MRFIVILSLAIMMIGCGYGSRNYSPGMTAGGSAAPTMSAMTPNSMMAGSGGFIITVNGQNFGTDAVVFWNGTPQSSMYVTGNQVTATITSADIMNPGMIPVYVRTGGRISNTLTFDVQ